MQFGIDYASQRTLQARGERLLSGCLVNMAEKDWNKFKDKMKSKKAQKIKEKPIKGKEKTNELVIQRLSATVAGKAQKYSRIGPREFVAFDQDGDEFTIEGIKKACERHFAPILTSKMTCDILAGEQGPSCSTVAQIPNTKLIHVRFIAGTSEVHAYQDIEDSSSSEPDEVGPDPCKRTQRKSKSEPSPTKKKVTEYPRSLSVVDMMKLGRLVKKQRTSLISLHAFNISDMSWTKEPMPVEFTIEEQPLGTGGFRKAMKASTTHSKYSSKLWVVKIYLPKALDDLRLLNQPVDCHTKKVVQMHSLARNFAVSLANKVKGSKEFGQPIQYTEIYYGTIDEEETVNVTVEEFVPGEFIKFITNNGEIVVDKDSEFCKKAQCLAHYSYEKSEKSMMVLDIQGSGNVMYDPEIATSTSKGDDDGELLFCAGNLSDAAITNFIAEHKCNEYCFLAGLQELTNVDP